ncbi:hypothetical protein ACFOMD_10635 [Sphingoaurantiacus capsulatus]|uniref:Uncharacterized protein n=1 Tax=Sphingoaurantiacus capsulatus TaxID=1771310 RepID=A0ABV7XAT7_9SPHN
MTGLAFVFVLLLVAAAGMRPNRSVAPANAEGETLAQLGVAPGSSDMLRRAAHNGVDQPKAPKKTTPNI